MVSNVGGAKPIIHNIFTMMCTMIRKHDLSQAHCRNKHQHLECVYCHYFSYMEPRFNISYRYFIALREI